MITPTQMKQKIKNIQTKTGIPAQLLQRNFIMERFLFRLSQSAYKENFILKGGYLVGNFIGSEKRTTMDLDATVKGFTLSLSKIKQVLTEIGQIETDDGITYDVPTTSIATPSIFRLNNLLIISLNCSGVSVVSLV